MMKTEIYIATHKEYNFPRIEGYIPIHVGKALTDLDLGIIGDNTGDNISNLNPNFCELTALYWMWKNSNADILGLVHYRRYFLDVNNIESLSRNEIIIPKKVRYYKEGIMNIFLLRRFFTKLSIQDHYKKNHISLHWDVLRGIICHKFPEYLKIFDMVSNSKSGMSHYNMFIAHKDFVNGYCEWLFNILFELKNVLDLDDYDAYQRRVYGFISERLLNVYIEMHKKNLKIRYKNVSFIS